MKINEIIEGITCETCSEERTFGNTPNDNPDNKYIYLDLSGSTRCFCKKHMTYCKKDGVAIYDFEENEEAVYPCYGAKLISDILKTNNPIIKNDE